MKRDQITYDTLNAVSRIRALTTRESLQLERSMGRLGMLPGPQVIEDIGERIAALRASGAIK